MQLRKEKGLTQQQLGEKLYITDKAVSKWERGLSFPDITILKSLSEILEVDVSELLNCEKGKKDNIDIQKAVDDAVKKIDKIRKEKIRKKLIIISILTIIIIAIFYFSLSYYRKYHPDVIVNGENSYTIGTYDISEKGLDKLINIIQSSDKMTERYTISYFEAKIDKNAKIESFTLSLNAFNVNNEYVGRVGYTYRKNILSYTPPTNDNLPIVIEYDANSSIEYISNSIKQIPLKEQIKASQLKNYVIRYQPNTILESGTPIFDMTNGIKESLSKDDYNSGKGGISDGNTNIVIRLYDGTSIVSEEQYLYVFNTVDNNIPNNPNYMMQTDYYINNGNLKFTRDYGNSWINTDITKVQLEETLKFYNNSLSLVTNSWFISENEDLPIAYFYGKQPVLKLSLDNGNSWAEIKFDGARQFGNYITRRIVGFTSKNIGYVALGTDWSTSLGENKKLYLTHDFGKTWEERELPLNGTSSTLIDICMYDENVGIVALDNNIDINFPVIYATKDGGKSWQEVKFSYFNLPDQIQYLIDIDSIVKENDEYVITLGQGEEGTLKAVFKTRDLSNSWLFVETRNKNIHKVG